MVIKFIESNANSFHQITSCLICKAFEIIEKLGYDILVLVLSIFMSYCFTTSHYACKRHKDVDSETESVTKLIEI